MVSTCTRLLAGRHGVDRRWRLQLLCGRRAEHHPGRRACWSSIFNSMRVIERALRVIGNHRFTAPDRCAVATVCVCAFELTHRRHSDVPIRSMAMAVILARTNISERAIVFEYRSKDRVGRVDQEAREVSGLIVVRRRRALAWNAVDVDYVGTRIQSARCCD